MPQQDEIILEEYDDSEFKQAVSSNIKYPSILIEGIDSEEELAFFKSRYSDPDMSLPLYCMFDDVPFEVGKFELSFDSLLALRVIFEYKLWLQRSQDDKVFIDLNNPVMLLKFIKL